MVSEHLALEKVLECALMALEAPPARRDSWLEMAADWKTYAEQLALRRPLLRVVGGYEAIAAPYVH